MPDAAGPPVAGPRRVLVFGLGHAGRLLAARLQAAGIACVGTVRDPARALPPCGAVLRRFDGNRAEAALMADIAASDAVVASIPPDADGDPACRRFADALAVSGVARIVYLSSTGVYGDRGGGRIDETAAADACHPAALARLAAEAQWRALGERAGIPVAVLRLPGLYGPGRNALVQLARGHARHVVRPGLAFSRLHVEDLAEALFAALHLPQPAAFAVHLLADDEAAPPQDVLAFAAALSGLPLPPAQDWRDPVLPESLRRFYQADRRIDDAATRALLGWSPRHRSYREGLRALWAAGEGRPAEVPV